MLLWKHAASSNTANQMYDLNDYLPFLLFVFNIHFLPPNPVPLLAVEDAPAAAGNVSFAEVGPSRTGWRRTLGVNSLTF